MRTLMLFGLLVSSLAQAAPLQVCRAQCVGISSSEHVLSFLGGQLGVAATRQAAWAELGRRCKQVAQRQGLSGVLAEGSVYVRSSRTYESIEFFESLLTSRSYRYSSVSSSSTRAVYTNDEFEFALEFAKAKDSCAVEDVHPSDLQEEYDGELPVLG